VAGIKQNLLTIAAVVPIAIWVQGGCGLQPPCGDQPGDAITVVLTFDDGPLPGDVAAPGDVADRETLLDPLRAILDVLERRGLRAVFFVAGPGFWQTGQELIDTYAQGIEAIHAAGHVLGYHAFDHDPYIWAPPFKSTELAEFDMSTDLYTLKAFLNDVMATLGLRRVEVFEPVFRQPYGGGGTSWLEGWTVASRLGWTYHGYLIDSADWLGHEDAASFITSQLPPPNGPEHVEYVLDRLRNGAARNAGRSVVDVLFHVNHFTAEHLDQWIDELTTAFQQHSGREVIFDVPECYLRWADPTVDNALIGDVLSAILGG